MDKLVVLSVVAIFAVACGSSATDACEHVQEVCDVGDDVVDCGTVQQSYDELDDAGQEKADEGIDCVMDAETCDAIGECDGLDGNNGGGNDN